MELTYEVLSKEVPQRGKRFANKVRFLEWCSSLAHKQAVGMEPKEFYGYIVELIAQGRLDVYQRKGHVWVRVIGR